MTLFHILVATELTGDALDLLNSFDDVTSQVISPSMLSTELKTAHALICRDNVYIDADWIANAPKLKVIGRVGAGLSGIDIDAATARGIMVMNMPGASSVAAAEHTLALILALSRDLIAAHNSLHTKQQRPLRLGKELSGKTVGVVGLGRVGKTVAQRCLAFGMHVIANDPYIDEDETGDERISLVGLKELLKHSDFVTIHVPETDNTRHLFDETAIARMKPGAYLVNIAQGSVIDERALVNALQSGHLAGAAVDVYGSPSPQESSLIALENVIHTPHIAENTIEAVQDLSCHIVEQVVDALRGKDYRNVVNMPFTDEITFKTIHPYVILAERIGTVLASLARQPIQRLAVECRGDEVFGLIKPLTVAMLKGLLSRELGEGVNYVNAPLLADERGIQVIQAKGMEISDYSNLVSCKATLTDGEDISMAGTLLDHRDPYIVRINDYKTDFVPEGHMLIMGSRDKPGVIGRIGMLLAENDINIADWYTGREKPGGNTLTIITLDMPLPDKILNELIALDFVRHARQVKI